MEINKDIKKLLTEELRKSENEKTKIQIRLFDGKTGSVTYKHLTRKELHQVLKILSNLKWL